MAGVESVTCCLLSRWPAKLISGHFDVMILCPSVAKQERALIAESVRSRNHAALVVLIDRHPDQKQSGRDAGLSCAPGRLLKDLPLLLHNRLAA